jgi:hypothetical protein
MKYQICIEAVQAQDGAPDGRIGGEFVSCDANINPTPGLASDRLNHCNEAIMLLEMLPSSPDCRDEFLAWRPASYREHFAASRFKGRNMAIAAYEADDPNLRDSLDALGGTMTAILEATREELLSNMPPEASGRIGEAAAARLKPLIARAGTIINGESDDKINVPARPQAVVDLLMKRSPA